MLFYLAFLVLCQFQWSGTDTLYIYIYIYIFYFFFFFFRYVPCFSLKFGTKDDWPKIAHFRLKHTRRKQRAKQRRKRQSLFPSFCVSFEFVGVEHMKSKVNIEFGTLFLRRRGQTNHILDLSTV